MTINTKRETVIKQINELFDGYDENSASRNILLDYFPAMGASTSRMFWSLTDVFNSYKEMLAMLKDAQEIIKDEYPESQWDEYSVPKRQHVIDKAEAMTAKPVEEVIDLPPPPHKETTEAESAARWVFERSSGYTGWRCQTCSTWVYYSAERTCTCTKKGEK